MNYNHGKAQKAFEREWADTEAYFRENGMTEEQIAAMHEYDWEAFKSERRYQEHTVKFNNANSIMLSSPEDTMFECSESEWLHTLPLELAEQLSQLKKDKLTAFYYHVVYGLSLTELAAVFNKNRCTIRCWIRKVYKVCNIFKKNHHFCPSKRLYSEETEIILAEHLEN
ncbi:MAG: hypothetical protein IKG82_15260 [Oscillospiraceae bacterium]|nr:hypothetical protein [Oscillospiraceae bacterium]MBR3420044.1 hypothetical protein [Oscillospiraceae bacterium]